MSGTLDDYELGLAVARAAGADRPHLVDPVLVERVGTTMRPPLIAIAESVTRTLAMFAALPEDVRGGVVTAARGAA